MTRTTREIEEDFIEGLKTTTGRDLKQWMAVLKTTAPVKSRDALAWLKTQHGFGHMSASLLLGIYANSGRPVYGNDQSRFGPWSGPRLGRKSQAIVLKKPEKRTKR